MASEHATPAPSLGWTLRSRLGRWFLVLLAVFVALGAALIASSVLRSSSGDDVIYKWQPALNGAERMFSDLVNQETGVRGFLLAPNRASLAPYTQYRAAQATDEAYVRERVSQDASIVALLDRFHARAEEWNSRIAQPAIREARAGAHPGVTAIDAGRASFNRIRAASSELTDGILAKVRAARAARSTDQLVFNVLLGVTLAVLLLAGYLLWRGLHRFVLAPVDRLAAQTRHVAAGQLRDAIEPGGPIELSALGADVEYMRAQIVTQLELSELIQDELRRQGEELERSNADLQQFAYVASHDLSEPLRKVSNFCQLLERQYGGQLDDRARQYIFFAVDGAKRMQNLITDLLALSRVGRTTEEFVPVELGGVVERARATLADRLADTGGRVEVHTDLPTVAGDPSLLGSLVENLIGNAVKYHREGVAPVVEISAVRDADAQSWTFTVADNGIGIEQEYAERIFLVFQRLHLRDQYGGTGIGLALCRKIVEFHGGRIWLDHVQSQIGSTFRFTLPATSPAALAASPSEGAPRAEHHG